MIHLTYGTALCGRGRLRGPECRAAPVSVLGGLHPSIALCKTGYMFLYFLYIFDEPVFATGSKCNNQRECLLATALKTGKPNQYFKRQKSFCSKSGYLKYTARHTVTESAGARGTGHSNHLTALTGHRWVWVSAHTTSLAAWCLRKPLPPRRRALQLRPASRLRASWRPGAAALQRCSCSSRSW